MPKPRWYKAQGSLLEKSLFKLDTTLHEYRKRRLLAPLNHKKTAALEELSELGKQVLMAAVRHFCVRLPEEGTGEWVAERPALWNVLRPVIEGSKMRRAQAERLAKEVWKVWHYEQGLEFHANEAFGLGGTNRLLNSTMPVFFTKTDFRLTFDPEENGKRFRLGAYLKDGQGSRMWTPLIVDQKTLRRIKRGVLEPREIVFRKRTIGEGEAAKMRKRYEWAWANKWVRPIEGFPGRYTVWVAHLHCRLHRAQEDEKVSNETRDPSKATACEFRPFTAPREPQPTGNAEQVRQHWADRTDRRLLSEALPPGLGVRYLLACEGPRLREQILKEARARRPIPRRMAGLRSELDAVLS